MLRPNAQDLKVFLHRATVDMRKGRHGLAVLVREAMRLDVYSGALFIFIGRRLKRISLCISPFRSQGASVTLSLVKQRSCLVVAR